MKNLIILVIFLLTLSINAQCWQKISAGNDFTLAIKSDGTLWAWGNNDAGELGDGTNIDKYTTTQIGTATDWQSVAAGSSNSYALKTNGTLWAWGNGGLGQLGNGGLVLGDPGFNDTNYTYIPIQVGTDSNWQNVKSGTGHVVALKSNGTIWAWGYNAYGQVGDGTGGDGSNFNIKKYPTQIGTANNWQFIDCGFRSSFAIKNDGSLWAWGRNDYGQLGDGTNVDKNTPVQIGNANNWYRVSISGDATLALKTDGTLWSWGRNVNWQLGTGQSMPNTNVPIQVGTATNWQSISAGGVQSTAIKTDGTLWVWGEGFYGFGDGTNTPKDIPTQIGTATDWQTISAGGVHTAVIKTNNTLWNWGWNSSGQLANGTNTGNANNNTQNLSIQVSCTSLSTEEFLNSQFEIYPNPANEIIYFKNNLNNQIQNIKIIDLAGKIIFITNENLSEINIQNLETGIYIISITSENKIYNYKIVKN